MNFKKIIIFGGRGFIGTNLTKYFIKKKLNLILIGRKVQGVDSFTVNEKKKIKLIETDIFNTKKFEKINYTNSLVIFSAINRKTDNQNFKKKLSKLFIFLSKKKIGKFILLSSISVYGNYKRMIKENTKLKPSNNYAKNCLNAENLIKKYQYKFNIVIIRIANVFGIFRNNLGFIENILYNHFKNKVLLVNSHELVRSYVSIEDISKIIYLLSIKNFRFVILNLSNPFYIFKSKKIIKIFEKLLRTKIRVKYKKQKYIILNSKIKPKKLIKLLNYKFQNNIENDFSKLITFYENKQKKFKQIV